MNFHHSVCLLRSALAWLVLAVLAACGGGDDAAAPADPQSFRISGQALKGPLAIGSQVSVNTQDTNLSPNGRVYNVQTADDLGNFSVQSGVDSNLVEIVADGFYMDELTGKLSSAPIRLRAVADLVRNANPTVNALTTLQALRLKTLVSRGSSFAAAADQSQAEVLAIFGIDPARVNSLSGLDALKINGDTDADAVLLATSAVLSQMASDLAAANGTTAPAELSNLINQTAALFASNAEVPAGFAAARNLAETHIDLAAVRANVEGYYANRGVTMVAPKFEEWIDRSGSGTHPVRIVPVTALAFTDVTGAIPGQVVESNTVTIGGIGTGVAVQVTASLGVTLVRNDAVVDGPYSVAQDGDTFRIRMQAPGYRLTATGTVSGGSVSATWNVASGPFGGTISGLTGTGLVLQLNGAYDVAIDPGASTFTFPVDLPIGNSYSVSVLSQPTAPVQICRVANAEGVAGMAQPPVAVICALQTEMAYVTDQSGITASYIDALSGQLTQFARYAAGIEAPGVPVIHPGGGYLFVPGFIRNQSGNGSGVVEVFASTATGELAVLGLFAKETSAPHAMALTPSGQYAYLADNGANSKVFAYSVTAGALSFLNSYSVGTVPSGVTVHPSGKFVYVVSTHGAINIFSIGVNTGLLTAVGTVAVASEARSITFGPSGSFAYLLNSQHGVTVFTVDQTTGMLSNGALQASTTFPSGMAIEPSGKFAYIGSDEFHTIAAYSIDSGSGSMALLASLSTATVGGLPVPVVDPSGRFVYLSNGSNNTVRAYTIDSATGGLTAVGDFPSGQNGIAIKVLP